MVVVFDNWCRRCTNFVRVIKKIDWLQRLTFKELRSIHDGGISEGIDIELAKREIASYDGRWKYGFNTIYRIVLRIPILWFFVPLFWLLKFSNLGEFIYLQLAVRRKIIPLHCSDNSCINK